MLDFISEASSILAWEAGTYTEMYIRQKTGTSSPNKNYFSSRLQSQIAAPLIIWGSVIDITSQNHTNRTKHRF